MIKRALVVFAHPSSKSFCGALRDVTIKKLDSMGFETTQSDLYQMKFNPVFDFQDFQSKKTNVDKVKGAADIDVKSMVKSDLEEELSKLKAANYLFFIAPTWMGSFPAILKGWMDRVFTSAFYGNVSNNIYKNGCLKGKKSMIITSTGFDKEHYSKNGVKASGQTIEENYRHIYEEAFAFHGIETFPIFPCYGMDSITPEQREFYLNQLCKTLENIENLKPIYIPLLHNH